MKPSLTFCVCDMGIHVYSVKCGTYNVSDARDIYNA